MSKVAEGLTGSRGADFVLFPRSTTIYLPVSLSTATFLMNQGFNIRTVTLVERNGLNMEIETFWTVEPSIREIFARLATIEAVSSLDALDKLPSSSVMYPKLCIAFFRAISAVGASGLWFKASWQDMIVAGLLAIVVTLFEGSKLWKHERIIFEVIVSFVVGLLAGLVAYSRPETSSFGAMAVGAVVDILQGFRVVYPIMEVCI